MQPADRYDLPESVRLDEDAEGWSASINSAVGGWDARLTPAVAAAAVVIAALLLPMYPGAAAFSALEWSIAAVMTSVPVYWGLKVLAVSAALSQHVTTRIALHSDRFESAVFSIPLSTITDFSIVSEGERSALMIHTRQGPVRVVRHHEPEALDALRGILQDWWSDNPVPSADDDFTVRLPPNVRHETALGTQTLTLTSASSNLRTRRGLIVLGLVVALVLASSLPVAVSTAVFSLLGTMLVVSYIKEALSRTTTITLGQGSVSTPEHTVPLASIASVSVERRLLWHRLVVHTASASVPLASHAEEASLQAILAPIEQRVFTHRAALEAAGEDPDEVVIPEALAALRQPQR